MAVNELAQVDGQSNNHYKSSHVLVAIKNRLQRRRDAALSLGKSAAIIRSDLPDMPMTGRPAD